MTKGKVKLHATYVVKGKLGKDDQMRRCLMEALGFSERAKQLFTPQYSPSLTMYLNMAKYAKSLAESRPFELFMVIVITASAVLVAFETELNIRARNRDEVRTFPVIGHLHNFVLLVFIAEMLIKIIAEGGRPYKYFYQAWNVFDFLVIVSSCALYLPHPTQSSMMTIIRLFRLLRVIKIVRAVPDLQIIVASIIDSFGSILFATLIIFIFFYLYANIGLLIFRENDPGYLLNYVILIFIMVLNVFVFDVEHFGNLQMSLITLFSVSTLNNWGDIM